MKTEYSIKNSISSFICNIVSILLVFANQSVFIKTLGVEYNGLNGLFSNILVVLNIFELGIGSTISYHLYKYSSKNDKNKIIPILQYCKRIYTYIALSVLLFGLVTLPFIDIFIKEMTIDINVKIIYLLFIINTIASYLLIHKRILLFSFQRNYIINIIHTIYILVINIMQIIIIVVSKNYYLFLIIEIICIILENIFISIQANKCYPYIKNAKKKEINKKDKADIKKRFNALMYHRVSATITYGTDSILLSSFYGLTAVGLYTNYRYIINAVTLLFQGLINSTKASVGVMLNEKNRDRFLIYKRIKYLNHFLAIFTSVSLLILVEPFITLWLGKDFLMDNFILLVLVLNYYQLFMRTTFNVFKDAAGIWVEDKYIPVIESIINIVVSLLLIKVIGLPGIFIGTIISTSVVWFYTYPKFLYKGIFKQTYKDYYIELIKEIIMFAFIATITVLISNLIVINSLIISFILKIIIAVTIPNIIFIIINDKDIAKYYIEIIKKHIKNTI